MNKKDSIIISVKNIKKVKKNKPKLTDPYMTELELTKLLACREIQLRSGDPPLVSTKGNEINFLEIAKEELNQRLIPLVIKRTLPDGREEYWNVKEMVLPL